MFIEATYACVRTFLTLFTRDWEGVKRTKSQNQLIWSHKRIRNAVLAVTSLFSKRQPVYVLTMHNHFQKKIFRKNVDVPWAANLSTGLQIWKSWIGTANILSENTQPEKLFDEHRNVFQVWMLPSEPS